MVKSQALQLSARAASKAIVRFQADWAAQSGLRLDPSHWIVAEDSHRNLVVQLNPQDRQSFGDGAGNELETKMRAPHSSSALAYNCFAAARESTECLQAFARLVDPTAAAFTSTTQVWFEQKRPTGWKGISPHLDVEIRDNTNVIAVESKMTETYGAKTNPTVSLAPYLKFDEQSDRWKGMAALRRAAECLALKTKVVEVLDAAQLVKHALGLLRAKEKGEVHSVSLVLLWFDARELEDDARLACETLLEELHWLSDAIAPNIALTAVTHQDLIRAYGATLGNEPWIQWLEDRYLCKAGAFSSQLGRPANS